MKLYLRMLREVLWARKLSLLTGVLWTMIMFWSLKGYVRWWFVVAITLVYMATAASGVTRGYLYICRLARQMGFSDAVRDEILLSALDEVKHGRFARQNKDLPP